MPALSNGRHERFAQGLAKGMSATEAYVKAGYKANEGNAGRLNRNEQVQARRAELQEKTANRLEVTVESLTAELEEARRGAISSGQLAAAVSATMGKAKLHGKIVDQKHITGQIGTYDLGRMPDEQLEQLEAILAPIADAGGDPAGEGTTRH